jgi:hypothetical protein
MPDLAGLGILGERKQNVAFTFDGSLGRLLPQLPQLVPAVAEEVSVAREYLQGDCGIVPARS